ncbi:hypothetical protein K438DRAFT_2078738, partial [Mycena galopus ATCC 62051]
ALAIKPDAWSLNEDYLLDIELFLLSALGLSLWMKTSRWCDLFTTSHSNIWIKFRLRNSQMHKTEITHTLLTFLAFDGYPSSSWKLWNLPPLVEYSQYCLAHAVGQPEVQLKEMLLVFLGQACQWKKTMNPQDHWQGLWKSFPWNYLNWPSHPSALWIAAAANLVRTAKFLLEGPPLLEHSEDPEIIVASYYGYTEIVCILLDKGTDINAAGGFFGSSLQAAVQKGHTEIVCILLDKDADVNAAGGEYGSCLQAAAKMGPHRDCPHAL